jgi:hypothetical protein
MGDGRSGTPQPAALWEAVDRLVEGASIDDILYHRVGPLAARRWRQLGREPNRALLYEERAAALDTPLAQHLVQRVRERCDGPLVLFKGPEIARLYPASARRFSDIDLLSPDAEAVWRSLRAAGFVESPDEDVAPTAAGHHHLPSLVWPTIPLRLEVHARLNSPTGATQPTVAEILEASAPSALGVDGIRVPALAHHALILTAHHWQHEPLWTLRDLIDVAAAAAQDDRLEIDRLAAAWGIGRIWQTTAKAIDGVVYGGPPTAPLRIWARHLAAVRPRTVLDDHLMRWLSPLWELPPRRALAATARSLANDIRPLPGEQPRRKLARVLAATREMRAPVTFRHSRYGKRPQMEDNESPRGD